MLKVKDMSVNYGHISALRNASFEVKTGEIVCLIGSNGAGKSTTLCSISGLVEKRQGSVTFMDQDITRMRPEKIVAMGISHVPEGRHIFPRISVEENLVLGTMSLPKVSQKEMREKQERMYELFPRLKERRSQMGGTLSGGEQQMLAIARGLMCDPKLLMLDEPSLGLAPIVVDEIFLLLEKVKALGMTVLLVEQNANMALQIADHAYLLENGAVVKSGTGQELQSDDSIRKAYLGG